MNINKYLRLTLFIIFLLAFYSCGSDDNNDKNNNTLNNSENNNISSNIKNNNLVNSNNNNNTSVNTGNSGKNSGNIDVNTENTGVNADNTSVNTENSNDQHNQLNNSVSNSQSECEEHFFEDKMIPMRDGKSLSSFIRRPVNESCIMPVILIQTPYNKENSRTMWFETDDLEMAPLFANKNYAFVVADWRGFFGSIAARVLGGQQPQGEDGYDLVEWIAEQSWSNGKVGTWGVSALGVQQFTTALEQPPHLAASVPIFCQMKITYEQYYPGGVLRREYSDLIGSYFGGNTIVEDHPLKDGVWRYVEGLKDPADIKVPMMIVAGWYDLYNVGTFNVYNNLVSLSDTTVRDKHHLLIGDWIHYAVGGESSDRHDFTELEQQYLDKDKIIEKNSVEYFDIHLRGIESSAFEWEPVRFIRSSENVWDSSEIWPPQANENELFYFNGNSLLVRDVPGIEEIEYTYDPDDPSPTIGGGTLSNNLKHGPQYQDEVLQRGDVIKYVSAPLENKLKVCGKISINLKIKTTGLDTDFAVRLTAVDENDKYLLIGEGIRRLKLRDDFSSESEVVPGETYNIKITLVNDLAYTFEQGSRIGLIISSSNYPRFDKNPNNGDDFYTTATSSVTVTNTIITGSESYLNLPIY